MDVSVAIDGPVASGKSTVARAVARRLGAAYLDTGAMYRAVALAALRAGIDPGDESALLRMLARAPIDVLPDPAGPRGYRVRIGAEAVGEELFGADVAAVVSTVAALPGVRRELVARQRALAARGPVVMAGRDIGSVVLPDAAVKVYLTASADERVARRSAELEASGIAVDRDALRTAIAARDRTDQDRAVAPLRPAPGAVVLDCSDLPAAEVVERIVALAMRARERDA
jgi:cytidylate kinase